MINIKEKFRFRVSICQCEQVLRLLAHVYFCGDFFLNLWRTSSANAIHNYLLYLLNNFLSDASSQKSCNSESLQEQIIC